jgi:hypothetical protein
MKFARVAGASAVVAMLFVLTGCGGSSSADNGKKKAPTAAAGSARITSFVVPPSASCGGKTSTTVTVTYGTSGAAKQQLSVDGRPTDLTTSSGSVDVPVHCDALPHTFVLFAWDGRDRLTSLEKKLMTGA